MQQMLVILLVLNLMSYCGLVNLSETDFKHLLKTHEPQVIELIKPGLVFCYLL